MIPKRPRDPNELAKAIIDIATGERPDVAPDDKDPAAVQRGLHPLRLRSSVGKYGATRREVDVKGGTPIRFPCLHIKPPCPSQSNFRMASSSA